MTDLLIKRYTSRDRLVLAYRESAVGRTSTHGYPIVCIAGMTRNGRDFTQFADCLAPNHRVVRPDLRGRGASAWSPDPMDYRHAVYVDDLSELLDHCGIDRAVIIGTSLGGVLALRLAAAKPDRVAGIVLNDIGPGSAGSDANNIKKFLRSYAALDSWDETIALCKERFGATYPGWHRDDWRLLAQALYTETETGNVVPDYDPEIAVPFEQDCADSNEDLWDIFKTLNELPMLAVRGQRSAVLPLEALDEMQRAHASLRVAEVPNVGHAPTLAEPEALSAIDSFLSNIQPS